jgi:hypothetical protein
LKLYCNIIINFSSDKRRMKGGLRQKYWHIVINSIDRVDFSFYNLYAV